MIEHDMQSGEVMNTEIEHKFLPNVTFEDIPRIDEAVATKIDQGYLTNGPDGAVRVRREGDTYTWTFKGPPMGHATEKVELETEITKEQFDVMWPGTGGRRVEKTRYRLPLADHTVELDVFEGSNAGNMMAEIEFASTTVADFFDAPEWLGPKVTSDKRYGNASIAEHGFPG